MENDKGNDPRLGKGSISISLNMKDIMKQWILENLPKIKLFKSNLRANGKVNDQPQASHFDGGGEGVVVPQLADPLPLHECAPR